MQRTKNYLLCILIFLWFGVAFGMDPEDRDAHLNEKPCDQCHIKEKTFKYLHIPTHVDACMECHVSFNSGEMGVVKQGNTLCFSCHQQYKETVHYSKDIPETRCLTCHNPHGERSSDFLRVDSLNDSCIACHEKTIPEDYASIHTPVKNGLCISCHGFHTPKPGIRTAKTNARMCFQCHQELQFKTQRIKTIHTPLREAKCLSCHDAHTSLKYTHQLNQDTIGLCKSCHKEHFRKIDVSRVSHGAITREGQCMNCHDHHFSQYARGLKMKPEQLCYQCHNQQLRRLDGSIIPNMKALITKSKFTHGPIKESGCPSCHSIHGGQYPNLLVKDFPKDLYASFDLKRYELCFSCHQSELVTSKNGIGVTDFRDKNKNLHFLHVNRMEKGRSCRVCHDVHASSQLNHIRASFIFGKKETIVGFQPRKTGGTCLTGCHKEWDYTR